MPRKITAGQKHALMTKLLSSKQGRQRIASTVQEPLRKLRDYVSIGRKALFIDELPDGTLPIYDLDVDTPAYVVGEEADSIEVVVKGKRLLVPLFELASNPTIPFTQVKERRFDIVRRIKQKSKDELFRKEDSLIFAAMNAAATDSDNPNSPVACSAADLGMDDVVNAFSLVESRGLRVDKVFLNPKNYKMFRNAGRDYVDFETQRELLRTGLMGNVYGAAIYQSVEVPENKIFCVSEPEYLGVLPVRLDLTVIPADVPTERKLGWSIFENCGIGFHNPQAISHIAIS